MDQIHRTMPKNQKRYGFNLMQNKNSTVIVVWRKLSRRSELLAEALNAKLWFFKDNLPYARAALKTLMGIIRRKPKVLVVQLPQGPLLLEAYLLKKLVGCKVVADVHTGFLVSSDWKGLVLNTPFVKLLPLADLIVAHNQTQLQLVPKRVRRKTIVAFDPWHLIETQAKTQAKNESYVVFPASFASDEPLQEVIEAAGRSDLNIKLYITGNWKRKPQLKKYETKKIVFTGYLSSQEFGELLANAAGIIAGTKREYTSLMSAWEAVAYAKPLAVTATATLKDMLQGYAVFYDWKNQESIIKALQKISAATPDLKAREELKQKTLESVKRLNAELNHLASA
jgi:glycosyltransferase involved in cell wall biosynthesis